MERREFIGIILGAAGSWCLPPLLRAAESVAKPADVAVAKGTQPRQIVTRAIDLLGGMKRFVKPGEIVLVKPNIGWDRLPEQGANTNPEVVSEIIKMCYGAGAKKVRLFDNSVNNARACYERSGIAKAAREAGADVSYMNPHKFKKMPLPGAEFMKEWEIYTEALECDCLINVPIAKTHSTSTLTLGMKNLMGLIGGRRGYLHMNIHQALAELTAFFRPRLTVLDAYRVMVRNGPTGGSPRDVEVRGICIASPDPIATDVLGASLFGLKPEQLAFITKGQKLGLGEMQLKKLKIAGDALS